MKFIRWWWKHMWLVFCVHWNVTSIFVSSSVGCMGGRRQGYFEEIIVVLWVSNIQRVGIFVWTRVLSLNIWGSLFVIPPSHRWLVYVVFLKEPGYCFRVIKFSGGQANVYIIQKGTGFPNQLGWSFGGSVCVFFVYGSLWICWGTKALLMGLCGFHMDQKYQLLFFSYELVVQSDKVSTCASITKMTRLPTFTSNQSPTTYISLYSSTPLDRGQLPLVFLD